MFRAHSMRAGILVGASFFAMATAAFAQADRGTITGQVTDQSAAIITGASVKAVHVATNFERQVKTSGEGSYTIPQLPVGGYVVIVTASNFQTTTLENIEVNGRAPRSGSTTQLRGGVSRSRDRDVRRAADPNGQREGHNGNQQQVHSDLPLVVGGHLRSPLDLSLIAPEAKAGNSGDGWSLGTS